MYQKVIRIGVLLISVFSSLLLAAPLPIYNEQTTTIEQNTNEPAFIIELKSNRTTGYSWSLDTPNPSDIQLLTHEYLPPKEMIAGAAGVERWTFQLTRKALASQRPVWINFTYKRPWESGNTAKTQTFLVVLRTF